MVFPGRSFLRSKVMKRAPGVDMTELKSSLAVVKAAVGELTSYRHTIKLPPAVRRVRSFSCFCGR